MTAIAELQAGAAGEEFVALLRRTIRAVGVSRNFPPPEGHPMWDADAVHTAAAEFMADRQTPQIVFNTAYLVVATTGLETLFGLGLAVLMASAIRGIGLIRTAYLLPIMTAPIVVALTWRAMFNNDAGWINYGLSLLGLPEPTWLGEAALAMPVVIVADSLVPVAANVRPVMLAAP